MDKITKKEDAFAMAIVDGHSQYESYLIAYQPNSTNRSSIDAMASKIANKPHVKARIQQLKDRKENRKIYSDITDENYIYSVIQQRLKYCMDNNNDNAVAKYIEILNKMTGRYVNITKDISDTNTLSDVSTEKLQAILDMKIEDMDNITPGIQN